MDSRRTKIIALVVAVLLTFIFYIFISSRVAGDEDTSKETITVVVANQDIAAYSRITEEMISQKEIAVDEDMKSLFPEISDSLGKIAKSQIYQNDIITKNILSDGEDNSLGLASKIEEGMRAITIAVDIERGLSDTIRVGNFVDLIYIGVIGEGSSATEYFQTRSGDEMPVNTQTLHPSLGGHFSSIALQNVKVISLDEIFYKQQEETQVAYQSVTLEVTPEEATQIALLPQEGNIRLALRPMDDDEIYTYPRDWIIKDTAVEVNDEEEEEVIIEEEEGAAELE